MASCVVEPHDEHQPYHLTQVSVGETLIPAPLALESTVAPETDIAKEIAWSDFEGRNFNQSWVRVHQIRSSCIGFDSSNNIWALSVFGDLEYFDGNVWNIVSPPGQFDEKRGCPHVSADGTVWFYSSQSENIALFDGENWSFIDYPDIPGEHYSLTVDATGKVWLGLEQCDTNISCLYRFSEGAWEEQEFPFTTIHSIVADSKGEVWIGGDENTGIAHYSDEHWFFYDAVTLWPESARHSYGEGVFRIKMVLAPDETVWATVKGYDWVRIVDGDNIERYPNMLPIGSTNILSAFVEKHKRIWFVTDFMRLGYFDYEKNQGILFEELPSSFLGGALSSPDGSIWLVISNNLNSEAGLYRYSPLQE